MPSRPGHSHLLTVDTETRVIRIMRVHDGCKPILYTEIPLPAGKPMTDEEIDRFLRSLGEVIALDMRALREALGL